MRAREKVLHVLTTSAGGLGQSVLTIMTSLDADRYELHAAFGPGYPLDGAFAAAGISTHMLALSRGIHPLQFARTLMQLARIMRRERFDIVHVHGSEAGVLARLAAWITRVPRVVVELHGYANRDPDSLMERTVYRWIERALDPLTDAYVAVSEAVRRAWVARGIVTQDRVRVIHHGLDLSRYADRERAPRNSPGLVVGTVCLLEERKGLLALVEAMPRVIRTAGDVRFVIVGEGPLKARMQQRIAELGIADRVDFLGWRFDVPQLMWQFDVFALASLRESFGLVYLEAMACRCPVVAARVDGVPEVVSDGETGMLVPPASPAELARALCGVLQDEATRERMGAAGRRRVVELFDVRRMAAAYEALYARLLAQPDAAAGRFALHADGGHGIE